MAQSDRIKSSAITFGGYLYQNLIGIECLCDWLDQPDLFEWVKFEADDDESPRGLDDVIAKRADGTFVLLQVKFTVDPFEPKNSLSWDWLTQHKPKGKSLLQKWSVALESESVRPVAVARLVTNRRPDNVFASCMNAEGAQITFDSIPADVASKVIEQLGSKERATSFFDTFSFQHSHQSFLSLRGVLLDRLVPTHTTYHGWHALFNSTVDWAVRKNFPPPRGEITLGILRGTLDSRRPAPLDQTFQVPEGYAAPDLRFHEAICERLLATERRAVVLWGSPGQGKSTYLSFLCQWFDEQDLPYIRHHYFLNLVDPSERFSFVSVANSLMSQMEAFHGDFIDTLPDRPESLRDWLEACGSGYEEKGKRFIVVVDGLDHVWRETEGNRAPLDALFKHLLPVPENVVLVLGTQRVAEEQLPARLNTFIEEQDWVELPLMSLTSTRSWLEEKLNGNQFELAPQAPQDVIEPIALLAETFHRVSAGHPLHLTYSFEAMRLTHRVFILDAVRALPDCPRGDIRTYYRSLWQRLSASAKDALHLVADAGFLWPPLGLEDALGVSAGSLTAEIGHLLYDADAGLMPFHGSLPAFIRDLAQHTQRMADLRSKVVQWLEESAPSFHRWGWLWSYQARCGSQTNLVDLPTRTWVIDSLAKAYPESQLVAILSEAESIAFSNLQFSRAVRLRWLKTRLQNGPEFQLQDFGRVYECALALTDDDYPIRTLSTSFRTASIDDLLVLGRRYLLSDRLDDAERCLAAIRTRLNDALRSRTLDGHSYESAFEAMLELAAATGKYDARRLIRRFHISPPVGPRLFRFFLCELCKREDISLLLEWLPFPLPHAMRRDLEIAIIRVSGAGRVHLHELPEFDRLRKHPLVECWARLYAPTKAYPIRFSTDATVFDTKSVGESGGPGIEVFLHGLFFHVVARGIELGGATAPLSRPMLSKRSWLHGAVTELIKSAATVAKLLVRRERPGFNFPFAFLRSVSGPDEFEARLDYTAFQRALLNIADDLFLLCSLMDDRRLVTQLEWKRLVEAEHFSFSLWLERCLNTKRLFVEPAAIAAELSRRVATIGNSTSVFNERAESYLELCELACLEGLGDVGRLLLSKTLSCVMGFGWRKDPTMHHVISALEALVEVDPGFVRSELRRICPAVVSIDVITDGDGTRSSKFSMAELFARLMPRTFASFYDTLLRTGEWYESENVLARLVPDIIESPLARTLIAPTLWDSESLSALRRLVSTGDARASFVARDNAGFYGLHDDELGKARYPDSTPLDDEHGIDVSQYAITELGRLIDELRKRNKYVGEERAVREWYDYWRGRGERAGLLRELSPYREDPDTSHGVAQLFDSLFEDSLRLEGKRKAYAWLVAAQIKRNGWHEYYSEKEALWRFSTFAKHYPEKWANFIIDTSASSQRYNLESLTIPHNRLVYFLVAVRQFEKAKQVATEMVSALVEEVSDQPLALPSWFSGN